MMSIVTEPLSEKTLAEIENRGLLTFSWVGFHDRPGSGGQRPPRRSMAMVIRAVAEW
jgi:hypothetical protein